MLFLFCLIVVSLKGCVQAPDLDPRIFMLQLLGDTPEMGSAKWKVGQFSVSLDEKMCCEYAFLHLTCVKPWPKKEHLMGSHVTGY